MRFAYWLGYKMFANNKVISKRVTFCCMFLHLKDSHCFISWHDIVSIPNLWFGSILIHYWFLKGHEGLHLSHSYCKNNHSEVGCNTVMKSFGIFPINVSFKSQKHTQTSTTIQNIHCIAMLMQNISEQHHQTFSTNLCSVAKYDKNQSVLTQLANNWIYILHWYTKIFQIEIPLPNYLAPWTGYVGIRKLFQYP